MNKMLIFGIIATLLIVGCTAPIEETYEQPMEDGLVQETPPQVLDEELITVSKNDGLSVATIKAVKEGSRWYFPLDEYEDEFLDVGLHSDSFIKLDSSLMESLEEGEAIWLIPMIKDGKGVLFDAIYSRDVEDCSAEKVTIIGKEYELSTLEDGPAFGKDDKWEVALDYDDSCLKRVVIYLDGYFYDITEDDHIALFRNDNTALVKFESLDDAPKIDVIVAKPPESERIQVNKVEEFSFEVGGDYGRYVYMGKQRVDGSGILIEFEPAIPVSAADLERDEWESYEKWLLLNRRYLSENHRLAFNISDQQWLLAKMRNYENQSEVVLGVEETSGLIYGSNPRLGYQESEIEIDGKQLRIFDRPCHHSIIVGLENDSDSNETITAGEIEEYKGKLIKIFDVRRTYHGLLYGDAIVFSRLVNLSDPEYNVAIKWENESSWNPALKSIFIPKSSPLLEKLSSQAPQVVDEDNEDFDSENDDVVQVASEDEGNCNYELPGNVSLVMSDEVVNHGYKHNYSERQVLSDSGLRVEFEPGIPICAAMERYGDTTFRCGLEGESDYIAYNHFSERSLIEIKILDDPWKIFRLRKNGSEEELMIGKEKNNVFLSPQGCWYHTFTENKTKIGTNYWAFKDVDWGADRNIEGTVVILIRLEDQEEVEVPLGELTILDGEYVYISRFSPGYIFCTGWAEVTTFSEILNFTDPSNNVTLTWGEESEFNPALESVSIPCSSPIFENLSAQ